MIQKIFAKLPFIEATTTKQYYHDLGFSEVADYGDYLILEHNGEQIHFFKYPDLIPQKSDFMLYLMVSQIEQYYQSFLEKSIPIHSNGKLERKIWKMQEFSLVDPNGTLLTFGERFD